MEKVEEDKESNSGDIVQAFSGLEKGFVFRKTQPVTVAIPFSRLVGKSNRVVLPRLMRTLQLVPALMLGAIWHRWLRAVRHVTLRIRSSHSMHTAVGSRIATLRSTLLAAHSFGTFMASHVTGPQLAIMFTMAPPAFYPGHPLYRAAPPATLQIEVGLQWLESCLHVVSYAMQGCKGQIHTRTSTMNYASHGYCRVSLL